MGVSGVGGEHSPGHGPQARAPAGGNSALERSVIKASHSGLLSAWRGLRMHDGPRPDYLQVQLGRVKNSISGAQAGRPLSHRRLLPVNEQEMASHFPGIAGRGLWCVYSLPRGSTSAPRAWRQGPGVREGALLSRACSLRGLLPAAGPPPCRLPPTLSQPNCFSFSHNPPPSP